MKLFPHVGHGTLPFAARMKRAFTLVEVIVTMALFSLVLGGLVYGNVFGLKMCEITRAKLLRSADARAAIGQLADEIRCAKTAWIGEVDGSGVFQTGVDGDPQVGNAIMICPTTNTMEFIVYFKNSDSTFRRYTSLSQTPVVLASMVTNSMIFSAEDYQGIVLTNRQNNRVIHVTLEFFQARGFVPDAEYFRLETAVTRRAID
ncbi:MAG TPA: prepilin-type N-terminal cleavage/methylation domain-containing protein [Candidatus Limnocylindria bacterium]|nr:prepilin-type N-terminal cleavage/methylation domain-containing protein [Candidatus Limnocylindria bacterium]